jgi:hypothetical protein
VISHASSSSSQLAETQPTGANMRTVNAACSKRLNAATMEHRFVSPSIFGGFTQLLVLLRKLSINHYVNVHIDSLQALLLFGAACIRAGLKLHSDFK